MVNDSNTVRSSLPARVCAVGIIAPLLSAIPVWSLYHSHSVTHTLTLCHSVCICACSCAGGWTRCCRTPPGSSQQTS